MTEGRKSLWRVCVCDVGTGSPQQSLVTLVSWQQAHPTNQQQSSHSRQEHNQQTQQEAKQKRATNDTPKNTQAAKRAGEEKAEERAGTREDSRRRPAAKGRQGEEARTVRGSSRPREGACSSSEGEYLSAGRKGTGTALATWCRGQSPTQGRSLCCHEEKWRQVPSCHNTPCFTFRFTFLFTTLVATRRCRCLLRSD